jgi:hypothetical protein
MDKVTIAGISLLLLIPGIVEAAKVFGVKGKASRALSLGLGVLFFGLAQAIGGGLIPAAWLPWIKVVVYGLSGGLAVSGYYDLVRRTGILRKPARGSHPF